MIGKQPRRLASLALVAVAVVTLAACGDDNGSSATTAPASTGGAGTTAARAGTSDAATAGPSGDKVTLRLGYFPNITHATPLVGIAKGIYADKLGPNVDLQTSNFTVGTKAMEALISGAIDATYVGPNPAVNAYGKDANALRVVSGATSGGASLVVKPTINSAADLKGKKIASPGLANTQDVALRSWLASQGLKTDTSGGGDVSVVPQDNALTLQAFQQGAIDGAWVPEPWATRLIREGGGKVLVNEADLWPNGQFATTELVVAKKFLDEHPDVVKRLLEAQVAANDYVGKNSADAQKVANDEIGRIATKKLADGLVADAWKNLTFTNDPVASSVKKSAEDAFKLGLLKKQVENLTGIFDLTLLNQVLQAAGQPLVSAPSS